MTRSFRCLLIIKENIPQGAYQDKGQLFSFLPLFFCFIVLRKCQSHMSDIPEIKLTRPFKKVQR